MTANKFVLSLVLQRLQVHKMFVSFSFFLCSFLLNFNFACDHFNSNLSKASVKYVSIFYQINHTVTCFVPENKVQIHFEVVSIWNICAVIQGPYSEFQHIALHIRGPWTALRSMHEPNWWSMFQSRSSAHADWTKVCGQPIYQGNDINWVNLSP